MTAKQITAAAFRAKCFELMDRIAATGQPITVTKRGRPVVRVLPAVEQRTSFVGRLAGTATRIGDVTSLSTMRGQC
jgi:prevent-host-death family protein